MVLMIMIVNRVQLCKILGLADFHRLSTPGDGLFLASELRMRVICVGSPTTAPFDTTEGEARGEDTPQRRAGRRCGRGATAGLGLRRAGRRQDGRPRDLCRYRPRGL